MEAFVLAEIIDFNFQREVGLLLNKGGRGEGLKGTFLETRTSSMVSYHIPK